MCQIQSVNQICSELRLSLYHPQNNLELESFLGDCDLESIVMRYAHGDCHYWTIALAQADLFYELQIRAVILDDTIIHSFISNDTLNLDATGVHTDDELLNAWHFITGRQCEIEEISYQELFRLVKPTKEETNETMLNISLWYQKVEGYLKQS